MISWTYPTVETSSETFRILDIHLSNELGVEAYIGRLEWIGAMDAIV